MPEQIGEAYDLGLPGQVTVFGSGLINRTWRVATARGEFIVQRVNENVFARPEQIEQNITKLAAFLERNDPGYLFVAPITTRDKRQLLFLPGQGYFRVFPFVQGSHTVDTATLPQQAYEAARQFARFTRKLSSFPVESLGITIPDFHNLSLRYRQFEESVSQADGERKKAAGDLILLVRQHRGIVAQFENDLQADVYKRRVTHHDTKISNVLFDKNGKGLAVIDLDTVMPGYFISDVGDMMRTYLSPVSEEERALEKITARTEYFEAIAAGYLSEMAGELSTGEKDRFVFAGLFMAYMQALRFLADYLNRDRYYGAAYEQHNLVRAWNQATLLQRIMEQEPRFREIVAEHAGGNVNP